MTALRLHSIILALLLCLSIAPLGCSSLDFSGSSVSSSLSAGSAAPPLQVAEFVKGTPIDGFESGQVYVVEFWGTWCSPCVKNMPHLAKLQQRHGDKVKIIGIANEPTETVKAFLTKPHPAGAGKTVDEVATYSLAVDDNEVTYERYMVAAGQTGIPCAFIVGKDTNIRWIGHPSEMDRQLAAAINE